jgi:hypothetical protein
MAGGIAIVFLLVGRNSQSLVIGISLHPHTNREYDPVFVQVADLLYLGSLVRVNDVLEEEVMLRGCHSLENQTVRPQEVYVLGMIERVEGFVTRRVTQSG